MRPGRSSGTFGGGRPTASVADDETGGALEPLRGTSAVNTWNARRASVLSWPGRGMSEGTTAPAAPARAKRLTAPDAGSR
ncbi:hypothetical protein CP967_09110 [Streptomyces nitrosporeus]|uniref:Uncharacterized protein n=1 Tax=Streptomyces nitrosporeus TaxID=28894 RepID=A0A5J6F7G1_9ACTN|nr:hypothetical protein CP967_09110 [Streptomyces nitrosporeus]